MFMCVCVCVCVYVSVSVCVRAHACVHAMLKKQNGQPFVAMSHSQVIDEFQTSALLFTVSLPCSPS